MRRLLSVPDIELNIRRVEFLLRTETHEETRALAEDTLAQLKELHREMLANREGEEGDDGLS